jgi:hypothetical protein
LSILGKNASVQVGPVVYFHPVVLDRGQLERYLAGVAAAERLTDRLADANRYIGSCDKFGLVDKGYVLAIRQRDIAAARLGALSKSLLNTGSKDLNEFRVEWSLMISLDTAKKVREAAEKLHLFLDIIAILDPTPASESLNALLYYAEGDDVNGAIRITAAWVPLAGRLGKTGAEGILAIRAGRAGGESFNLFVVTERASLGGFRSASDLLRVRLGAARISHPEEFARIIKELEGAGVEIEWGTSMAYSGPKGGAGKIKLDPDMSIAALRHEFQHFRDVQAAGFPGLAYYYENPLAYATVEVRGYLKEIETARATGNADIVPKIIDQMKQRVRGIFGSCP